MCIRDSFNTIQSLNKAGKLLAYHDRSDGGLLTTLVEMAFAGRCGLNVDISALQGDAVSALYNEELGAVIQVSAAEANEVLGQLKLALSSNAYIIGEVAAGNSIEIAQHGKVIFSDTRVNLHRIWSETTYHMQSLRDNPVCTQQEYDRILDEQDRGLFAELTFDPSENIAAPYISTGTRPKMAILREQGVNGHVEMAVAFDRAGFATFDVHMSCLLYTSRCV